MPKSTTRQVYIKNTPSGPVLACPETGAEFRKPTLEETYRSEQASMPDGMSAQCSFPVPVKLTCLSMYRGRADAAKQRSLGLKVGGTQTEFWINDGLHDRDMKIVAWGATPGDRKTAALNAFAAGGYWRGVNAEARAK